MCSRPATCVRSRLRHLDEQLVVQAQHDLGVLGQGRAHRHRPHLEQLGRGALHDGVAGEPAARGGGGRVDRLRQRPHPHPPPAVRRDVAADRAGLVGRPEVAHRDRVGPLETAQRLAGRPGRLAVHRRQHGDLGRRPVDAEPGRHRCVQVVVPGRPRQRLVAGHRRQHPGLHLAQVGAHEQPAGLGRHRRPQLRRQVVQAGRGRHPAGRAVAAGPDAAQPAVGADVTVQPAVAVGRRDPLGLAPVEQGGHHRVGAAERLHPPGPGVGHVDADPGEQLAHLGRVAQVDVLGAGHQRADDVVAGGPAGDRRGRVGRPRPDPLLDEPGRRRRVERQPADAELHGEQLGRGLGPRRQQGQVRRRGGPAGVGQLDQRGLVAVPDGERGPRPARRRGHRRRAGLGPARPQVPVRAHRVVGVGRVALVGAPAAGEQVELPGPRPAQRVEAGRGRPHQRRVTVRAAVQQPVGRRHVPGRRHPQPGPHQPLRVARRPPDQPRPQLLEHPAYRLDAVAGTRHQHRAERQPHAVRGPGDTDRRPRPGTGGAQDLDRGHGPHPAGR